MLNKPIWTDVGFASGGRSGPEERLLTFGDVIAFLKRGRLWIVMLAALGAVVAGLYGILVPPAYTARAQIVIDPKVPAFFGEQGADGRFPLDTGQLASQMAILKSEKVALMVIRDLNLRDDPELKRPLARNSLQAEVIAALGLQRFGIGADEVNDRSAGLDPDLEAERSVLEAFNARLDVRRAGIAYALDVAFTSRNPDKAARIVNATIDAFMLEKAQARSDAARQAAAWLTDRIERVRAQMNTAVRAAQELRASHDYRLRRLRDAPEVVAGPASAARILPDAGPREAGTIEELDAAAETSRKVYESLTGVVLEATQRQSAPAPDSRVITAATRPLNRSSPGLRTIVPLGAFGGAGLYIGFGLVVLLMDGRVRTKRQVKDATGRDCLGWLARPRARWTWTGRQRREPPTMVEINRSGTALADGLRWTRSVLAATARTSQLRAIGLAPIERSTGGTAIALGLARQYAESGSRTLVIDVTMIGATVPKAVAKAPELARAEPEEWRRSIVTVSPDCHLLRLAVGGPDAVRFGPGLPAMEALLTSTREAYDMVIVDLPQARSGADTLALAHLLDGVVLLAKWGRTPLHCLSEAVEALEGAHARVLGSIVTDVDRTVLRA